jgi:hypothetical protein
VREMREMRDVDRLNVPRVLPVSLVPHVSPVALLVCLARVKNPVLYFAR